MTAFLESLSLVAISEIGDKTQLLSVLLAARFRSFWPIFFGVLVATLFNHGLTAWLGSLLSLWINSHWLHLGVSTLFIMIGLWVLIPDKAPEKDTPLLFGAFITSAITFFLAEMGDKTQLATLTLGANYMAEIMQVTIGTTAGMLLANIPAILVGDKLLDRLPLNVIRMGACALFVIFGIKGLIYGG